MSHTVDLICPSCEQKLMQASAYLCDWFHWAKTAHAELHISWSNRDQASQEQAFSAGTTKLHFPDSAHNPLPSRALDVFQLINNVATWDKAFLSALNDETQAAGYALKWGGVWKSLGDNDHFEIIPPNA